jgi:hypothetical protein
VPADFRRQVLDGDHPEAFFSQHKNTKGLHLSAHCQRADAVLQRGPDRLRNHQERGTQLEKDLQFVASPDTSAAFDFRNQLATAQLLLQIETANASFRIDHLREYLARNY